MAMFVSQRPNFQFARGRIRIGTKISNVVPFRATTGAHFIQKHTFHDTISSNQEKFIQSTIVNCRVANFLQLRRARSSVSSWKFKAKISELENQDKEKEEQRKKLLQFTKFIEEDKPSLAEDLFLQFRAQVGSRLKQTYYDQLFYSYAKIRDFQAMKRVMNYLITDTKVITTSHFHAYLDVLELSLFDDPLPAPEPPTIKSKDVYAKYKKKKEVKYAKYSDNFDHLYNKLYREREIKWEKRTEAIKALLYPEVRLESAVEEKDETTFDVPLKDIDEYHLEVMNIINQMKSLQTKVDFECCRHIYQTLVFEYKALQTIEVQMLPPHWRQFTSYPIFSIPDPQHYVELNAAPILLSSSSTSEEIINVEKLREKDGDEVHETDEMKQKKIIFETIENITGMKTESITTNSSSPSTPKNNNNTQNSNVSSKNRINTSGKMNKSSSISNIKSSATALTEKKRKLTRNEKLEEVKFNLYVLFDHLYRHFLRPIRENHIIDENNIIEPLSDMLKSIADLLFNIHCEFNELDYAQRVLLAMKNTFIINATSPSTSYVQYLFLLSQYIAKAGDYRTSLLFIRSAISKFPTYTTSSSDLTRLGEVYAQLLKYTLLPAYSQRDLSDAEIELDNQIRFHNAKLIYEDALSIRPLTNFQVVMHLNPYIFIFYARHHAFFGDVIQTQTILQTMVDYGFNFNTIAYNTLLQSHLSRYSNLYYKPESKSLSIVYHNTALIGINRIEVPSYSMLPTTPLQRSNKVLTLNDKVDVILQQMFDKKIRINSTTMLLYIKCYALQSLMLSPVFNDPHEKVSRSDVQKLCSQFLSNFRTYMDLVVAPPEATEEDDPMQFHFSDESSKGKMERLKKEAQVKKEAEAGTPKPAPKPLHLTEKHYLELFILFRYDLEQILEFIKEMRNAKLVMTSALYQTLLFLSIRYEYMYKEDHYYELLLSDMQVKKYDISEDCLDRIFFALNNAKLLTLIKFTSFVIAKKIKWENPKYTTLLRELLQKKSILESLSDFEKFLARENKSNSNDDANNHHHHENK